MEALISHRMKSIEHFATANKIDISSKLIEWMKINKLAIYFERWNLVTTTIMMDNILVDLSEFIKGCDQSVLSEIRDIMLQTISNEELVSMIIQHTTFGC